MYMFIVWSSNWFHGSNKMKSPFHKCFFRKCNYQFCQILHHKSLSPLASIVKFAKFCCLWTMLAPISRIEIFFVVISNIKWPPTIPSWGSEKPTFAYYVVRHLWSLLFCPKWQNIPFFSVKSFALMVNLDFFVLLNNTIICSINAKIPWHVFVAHDIKNVNSKSMP
jgi:hypothetical protein